jgi:hypothetical protein
VFSREHHHKSGGRLPRPRGATVARLIAPLTVVALLAVTAWLEFDARAAERSRRTVAESAVREYAAAATAQYSHDIATLLQSHLVATTAPIRDSRLGDALPPPKVLSDRAWQCNCGAIGDVLFTFRFDFDDGKLVPDRDLVAPVLRSLARHVPQALPQITENGNATADGSDATGSDGALRRTAMLVFDTVASQPFLFAYALVADATNRPRSLYGVATDPRDLREAYERLARSDSLLPASITKGRPNDSLMAVRTTDATSGTVFARPAPIPTGAVVHTDTLEAWLGAQVVTVAIRPELVSELLGGEVVPAPRPLQLTLLTLAAALTLLALILRRRLP